MATPAQVLEGHLTAAWMSRAHGGRDEAEGVAGGQFVGLEVC